MDVFSDMALRGYEGLPGVDDHAYSDRARPERLGQLLRRREGTRRGREGEEGVPLSVHLHSVVADAGHADQATVLASAVA